MTTIYVKQQGAVVSRRGERLVVQQKGEAIDEFPIGNVDQLVLMGNIQVTTQAMAILLAREIDVTFLSSYGKYRGRLVGSGSKQAHLRQRQMQLMSQPAFNLELARTIVTGKIHNQRVILQRQMGRAVSLPDRERGAAAQPVDRARFERALAGMMQMRQAVAQAQTLESARGFEGKAAAYYFEAMRSLIGPEWGFARRAYYPPPDPFNALLSLAYSLLLKDVLAAVHLVGLDPYMGAFHEIEQGRPSLALDLMEEWRPVIADALALELVNRGSLKLTDFRQTGNLKRPVELSQDGMTKTLEAYGRRLETTVYHPLAGPGGQTALRQAIVLQVRRLARLIMDKEAKFETLAIR
jgi:CRISPR-associated protein Cas1